MRRTCILDQEGAETRADTLVRPHCTLGIYVHAHTQENHRIQIVHTQSPGRLMIGVTIGSSSVDLGSRGWSGKVSGVV